jgi:hypothetical protein
MYILPQYIVMVGTFFSTGRVEKSPIEKVFPLKFQLPRNFQGEKIHYYFKDFPTVFRKMETFWLVAIEILTAYIHTEQDIHHLGACTYVHTHVPSRRVSCWPKRRTWMGR